MRHGLKSTQKLRVGRPFPVPLYCIINSSVSLVSLIDNSINCSIVQVSKPLRKRQEDSDSEQSKDPESLQLQGPENARKNNAEHSECSESSFPGESSEQRKPKAERRKRKESRK